MQTPAFAAAAMRNSEPILAVFHSTAGGRTAAASEVWGEDRPYLRVVDVADEEDAGQLDDPEGGKIEVIAVHRVADGVEVRLFAAGGGRRTHRRGGEGAEQQHAEDRHRVRGEAATPSVGQIR